MKLIIPFIGGPCHGIKFEMGWVPQLNLMRDDRERCYHAYVREEMAYFYDKELSEKLTAAFDVVKAKFPGRPNQILPIVEE